MAKPEHLVNAANVRRDGKRIRRGNGTGYGDQVQTDQIRAHLIQSLCADDWQGVVFTAAVLNLREVEAEAQAGARDPQNSAQASAHDYHEPPQPAATTTPLEAHT